MEKYTLMHKNIPVIDILLDSLSGVIVSLETIYEPAHLPVGIPVKNNLSDRSALNAWWRSRSIPASRSGLKNALECLGIPDTGVLPEKCLGLSLSDQYWIRPADSGIKWEQINFFENPFSEDIGNILFGRESRSNPVSLMSPDNTSDGWLKKRWKIIGGKRCLIKGGSGATQQEPYNEVLASHIMERLKIPHVPYTLITEDNYPYSACEDFITPDTELVTAWHIIGIRKKPNHISVYQHYLDCCRELKIPHIQESLNQMLVLDFLIVNEDRHLNNFGAVRNANTLEYVGAAPIYDCGTALWFDKPPKLIGTQISVTCKPFKTTHEEQIKLVTDFSWIKFDALNGISEDFREITGDSIFIDEQRRRAVCSGLDKRIRQLEETARKQTKQIFIDSTQFDVQKNIAYSGKEC